MTTTLSSVGTDLSAYSETYSTPVQQIRLYNAKTLDVGDMSVISALSDLTHVKIGSDVSALETSAFIKCNHIVKIDVPNSVKSVGRHCFRGLAGLSSIDLNNNLTSLPGETFYSCSNLRHIDGISSVQQINQNTFANCYSLRDINLKSLCKTFMWDGAWEPCIEAFLGCQHLTSIYVDNNVMKSFGDGYGNDNACVCNTGGTHLYLIAPGVTKLSNDMISSLGYNIATYGRITDVKLPNITRLQDGAFQNSYFLSSVDFPKVTSNRAVNCFYNCRNLLSANLPLMRGSGIQAWSLFDSCSRLSSVNMLCADDISNYAFKNCTSLSSINLPGTLHLLYRSFYYCTNLRDISVENYIHGDATVFPGCNKLSNFYVNNDTCKSMGSVGEPDTHNIVVSNGNTLVVVLPTIKAISNDNITAVDQYAFQYQPTLSSLSLTSVEKICNYGIQYIYGTVSSLNLPNISSIGNYGLYYSGCVKQIICGNESQTAPASLGTNCFTNYPSDYKVYVPEHLYGQYLSATNWCAISSHICVNTSTFRDIAKLSVQLGKTEYPRTGNPVTPVPTIYQMDKQLSNGVDFSCTYENNIEIGTASLSVYGIGEYYGNVTKNFEIVKATGVWTTIEPFSNGESYRNFVIGSATKKNGYSTINIDWGDGDLSEVTAISQTSHTYQTDNTVTVLIDDTITDICMQASQYGESDSGRMVRSVKIDATNLTSLDSDCFRDMTYLREVDMSASNVSVIYADCFTNDYQLSSIRFGNNITTLRQNGASQTGIKELYFPSSLTATNVTETIQKNRSYMYITCPYSYSLLSLSVDPLNPKFDSRDNCNALIDTVNNKFDSGTQNSFIPSSVSAMKNYCFFGVPVNELSIPSNISAIPLYAFQYCYCLTDIVLPDTLTTIGTYAFSDCCSLEKILMPSSVMTIAGRSFQDSGIKLMSFDNHLSVPTLGAATALSGVDENYKIIVPENLYQDWISATNWTNPGISSHIYVKTTNMSCAVLLHDSYAHLNSNGAGIVRPQVYVGSDLLAENTDYTLTFSGNTTVGDTATGTVTGIGDYSGTQTFTFDILSAMDDWIELYSWLDDVNFGIADHHVPRKSSTLFLQYFDWTAWEFTDEPYADGEFNEYRVERNDNGEWTMSMRYFTLDSLSAVTFNQILAISTRNEAELFSGKTIQLNEDVTEWSGDYCTWRYKHNIT